MYSQSKPKKRVSIKLKIFLIVTLFIVLNIIINFIFIKISINDIYLSLEKRELKKQYVMVDKNLDDESKLEKIIYEASDSGIKVRILDDSFNTINSIFNNRIGLTTEIVKDELISLDNNERKLITLKDFQRGGYNIYMMGKKDNNYIIISSSIDSIKKDTKNTLIITTISSFVTFIIFIIISYFISKIYSRRINEIKDVTEDISNLRFDSKIEVKSNDELGDLYNNINEMSSKLEESIKGLEVANKKLKEDLEEKVKQEDARKKLVANISHEFKTPLTIISGYSQLLKEEVKKKEAKEYVNVMIDESERLSELVKEFLELSRLESGSIKLNKENINIKDIVENELKKLSVRIDDRKIKIEKSFEGNLIINADKKQITKVVENILTNAIKFCKDKMLIRIKLYVKDDYLYYEVFNTGDKIKEEELDTIFNSYYKDKSERNKEGTGLGLTIVKAIVDLHEGTCKVQNKKDGVNFKIGFKIK